MKMYIEREHKAYNYLQEMDDAICQTRNLTLQLLTFAKGGKPLTRAVSISRLIEETASFALSGSKSKYELILEKELPAVEIDQGQITQVITNLLINADQAMPEGGRIEIRAENQAVQQGNDTLLLQPGDYIVLTITDEGPGISNQNLIKIFDPYFTTKERGNGLGLTICYSIIKKHAGHISVHSAEGKGTSFTVYLPVSAKQAKQEEIPEDVLILGNERVLLMDDEASVRKTACEMLTFLGYEVESAADGSEAIRLYEEAFQSGHAFDVVIFDLTVRGGMGGKAAVAELLKINPDVKAIVSSGYSSDMLADYKKYGFCDVIAKPYRLQEMGNVLSNVLRGIKDH